MNNTIKQQLDNIENLKKNSKEQTSGLYEQIKSIEKKFNDQINDINNNLNDIKKKYMDTVLDLAIEKNECPRIGLNSYMQADDVTIDEDGLHITWYQSNMFTRDNYYYFSASWSEINENYNKLNIDN